MLLHYAPERETYTDRETGAAVTRYTGLRTNSSHLYFTNNSFYDNGRRIVFISDRGNAVNYFSLDLETGEIDQLTDFPAAPYGHDEKLFEGFTDAESASCAFFMGRTLYRLDVAARRVEPLYEMPEGFVHHIVSVAAGGKHILTSVNEVIPGAQTLTDTYLGHPLSRILRVAADGSGTEVVWEEKNYVAHVNASPTDPNLLTFCHEGGWNVVDHRLWALDLRNGVPRKLHPCEKGESIGHEYWYADGKRVGYHGARNGAFQLGHVDFDGTNDVSAAFPFRTGHIFSQDERLIVGDGSREGRYVRLWRLLPGGTYEPPRALCLHDCSFKTQSSHVHPRLTPDGRAVLYTSDATGYNQVYLVRLPEDLTSLPMLDTVSKY